MALILLLGGAALVMLRPEPVGTAAAASGDFGDFRYSSVSGGVSITAYTGKGGAVEIPSKINGSNVVAIAGNAFFQCDAITSVKIPNTVKTIGDNAFFCCTSMTSVTIPDSVTDIGVCAFSGCSKLGSVKLPGSLKNVKEAAFSDCTALTSVTVPDTAAAFKYEAFIGCTSLKTVTVPFKVAKIEDGAFGFSVTADENAAYSKISGFKLKCYMNSQAYIYAVENGLSYEILDPQTPDYIYGAADEIPDDADIEVSSPADSDDFMIGDVNADGSIDVSDVTMAISQLRGKSRLDEAGLYRADVNGDGHVNITDITMLIAHVRGVTTLQ